MKVRFYVEKRKSDDGKLLSRSRPIFMTVSFQGNRVLFSTGKKVDLQDWSQGKQCVLDTCKDADVVNERLSSLADTASVVWKTLASLSEKPGADEFRNEFERLRPQVSGRFFDVLLLYMQQGKNRWSESNYIKIRNFYRQFMEYVQETQYPVSFQNMNATFLKSFSGYFYSRGNAESTVRKLINTLVTFLNWATQKKYNIYVTYREFYKLLPTQSKKQPKRDLYLDWEELMKLQEYAPESTREERVQDLFLFMCYTGIRFTELQQMERDNLQGEFLQYKTGKGRVRKIPLNNQAKNIVSKYSNRYYPDNKAFPGASFLTMNKYLRKICRELNFTREVKGKPGLTISDLITVSTALNTFIYNALRLEMSVDMIGYFTGIKSDQRIENIRAEMAEKEILKFNQL